MTIYAVYKGENFLFEGTAKECAEHFNVKKTQYIFGIVQQIKEKIEKEER